MMVVLPSVMEKLPPTSYIRMVDVWLIVCQMLPFLQVAILTIREAVADDTAVINHHGFGRETEDKKKAWEEKKAAVFGVSVEQLDRTMEHLGKLQEME